MQYCYFINNYICFSQIFSNSSLNKIAIVNYNYKIIYIRINMIGNTLEDFMELKA